MAWYEDENLYQIKWIISGNPLYGAPNVNFVPFIYGPLYYCVSALLATFLGAKLFVLRLVSILATIITSYILYSHVRKVTTNKIAAFISVGLYAATYPLSKYSFDVGRVDALFMLLITTAAYTTHLGKTKKSHIISALCLTASVYVKQTGLIAMLIFISYYFFENRKYFKTFFLTLTFSWLGGLVIMYFLYNGWYLFYTSLAHLHKLDVQSLLAFWLYDIPSYLAIALFCAITLIIWIFNSGKQSQKIFLYEFVAFMGIAFLARGNQGGDNNVLLPSFLILSVSFGLFYQHLYIMNVKSRNEQKVFNSCFLILFMLVQFILLLLINPLNAIPTKENTSQLQKLKKKLQQTNSDIYLINHRILIEDLSKQHFAHLHTINELLGYYGDKKTTLKGEKVKYDFNKLIHNRTFGIMVLDNSFATDVNRNPFKNEIENNYKVESKFYLPYEKLIYLIYVPRSVKN